MQFDIPKWVLASKRFWLLAVPLAVKAGLLPLAKKAGIIIPDDTAQQIIDAILNLLMAGGTLVAFQGNPPVQVRKEGTSSDPTALPPDVPSRLTHD